MKIGAIVQARTSSSRLPGKVLKELPYGSGITVLEQVIRRLKKSKLINEIIIATTTDPEDKKLIQIAENEGIKSFAGSLKDVLSRYYFAAKENNINVIVRVTSDCPCIDPEIIDSVIDSHLDFQADYSTNALIMTFPHGLDVEVINFDALETAYNEATQMFEREHVCPFIYGNNSVRFKVNNIEATPELFHPKIRITLDTEEDYVLLCNIFDYLYYANNFFNAKQIITLFENKPWLELINKKTVQKKLFTLTLKEEINEAIKILELQELLKAKSILEKYKFKNL